MAGTRRSRTSRRSAVPEKAGTSRARFSARRVNVSKIIAGLSALAIAAALNGACANTVKGAQKDTEKVVEKTTAATNTVDVKSALIADGRVDASNINVDTSSSTKTVVLKGSVPTAQQKATAEAIARDKAEGYTINNQLSVVATKQ
jgi:osmotically-inducible protein OsmY